MYIALHQAGTEYHEDHRLSTAADPIEGVQGQFNMAIRDSLLTRHQSVVTIETDPESELAKTLSVALDEHRSRYQKYYEHCINEDEHDETWTRTHTDNVMQYCESTDGLLNHLSAQPARIAGVDHSTTSGAQRPALSRLQTSLGSRLSSKCRLSSYYSCCSRLRLPRPTESRFFARRAVSYRARGNTSFGISGFQIRLSFSPVIQNQGCW